MKKFKAITPPPEINHCTQLKMHNRIYDSNRRLYMDVMRNHMLVIKSTQSFSTNELIKIVPLFLF